MFQKSFNNHNRHFSGRHRFHFRKKNRQSNNGKSKKFLPESAYSRNSVAPIQNNTTEIKNQFSDFFIDKKLKENIALRGYITPTPIQDQAIQPILEGKDVIGIAETGSGKTAAFLIPLINKILHARQEKALIIVPTRELAVQINDDLKSLSRFLSVYSCLCIGGASINRQITDLRNNPSIVIGTPGRIKDLFNRRFLHLNSFKNIVLD